MREMIMSATIDESQLKAALTTNSADEPAPRKPFRLWPGVVAVVLQWLVWFVVPIVAPDVMMFGMIGGLVCGLAVLVWWLFFSRAPWSERLGAIVLMIVAVIATKPIVHQSIANAGMGMMMFIYSIPVLSLALVCWAVATRRLSSGPRRASMVAAILLSTGGGRRLPRNGSLPRPGTSPHRFRLLQSRQPRRRPQRQFLSSLSR